MPLTSAAVTAGSGLVSSSAVLVVIVGVLLAFLAHRPVSAWLTRQHSDVREHLYGPEKLHQIEPDDTQGTEESGDVSDAETGAQPDPDDGFDYSIFAAPKPQ